MALGRSLISLNAVSNITHSAIASQDSSRVTTTFKAHCIVHCTVQYFNENSANNATQSRYDTVPAPASDDVLLLLLVVEEEVFLCAGHAKEATTKTSSLAARGGGVGVGGGGGGWGWRCNFAHNPNGLPYAPRTFTI